MLGVKNSHFHYFSFHWLERKTINHLLRRKKKVKELEKLLNYHAQDITDDGLYEMFRQNNGMRGIY